MKLAKLFERLEYEVIQGTKEIEIAKVVNHSKDAVCGSLFICITGELADGCAYIEEAVGRGAIAVVTEKAVEVPPGITLIRVKDTRKAMAKIAAAFYDYPAEKLKIVGVTGTKGKTTTTYMIRAILERAGYRVGMIGTIEVCTGVRSMHAKITSPESLEIQQYLREMVDAGCDLAVMEVSSQGLKLHRIDDIIFDVGIFTNLGMDHIGPHEHKDFEEYKSCKAKLFRQCRLGIANIDNRYWKDIFKDAACGICTVGQAEEADYRISDAQRMKAEGSLGISYQLSGKRSGKITLFMPGEFNVYNSAAAVAACTHLGAPFSAIQEVLSEIQVRGRVERVEVSDSVTMMIDYAHNAMSLQSILEMVHSYSPERIVCIFGCGGNRAKDRRFEMGRVSGELADLTIITSDNPRYEEPLEIMRDIRTGIEKTSGDYLEICDRKEAVRYAICNAREGDVILLAGKGHEDYQEIKGIRYHMDDRELVRQCIINEEREICTQTLLSTSHTKN